MHTSLAQQSQSEQRATQLWLAADTDSGRAAIEEHIRRRFVAVHDARVGRFMPFLMALERQGIEASLGIRPATERLFIEQYLDMPLAQAHPALNIDRKQIIEVGNLASNSRHATLQIFTVLAKVVANCGFKEMVFCATREVAAILTRVGAELHPIVEADGRRMGETLGDWGQYYDHQPVVMRLSIASLEQLIANSAFLGRLAERFSQDIDTMAARLSSC